MRLLKPAAAVLLLLSACESTRSDPPIQPASDNSAGRIAVVPRWLGPGPEFNYPRTRFAAEVLFDFDRSSLSPDSKTALIDLVSKLGDTHLEAVIATGYADSVGSNYYNRMLTLRRAQTVKDFLVFKGIDPRLITTDAKTEAAPIEPNTVNGKDNPAGRAKNRRVEIEVIRIRRR